MSAEVAAPAAIVWAVISDPTRTAQWSHECNGVQFLDGVTESGPGVRFKGVNRSGRTGDATAWHFRTDALREGMRRVGALAERYHHSQSPA